MKRSFSFRCRTACNQTKVILDVLCVFFARPPQDIVVLTDEIQDCLKTNDPIPDVLYIIGTGTSATKIAHLWVQHPAQTQVLLERGNPPGLSAIKDFAVLGFDQGGFSRVQPVSATQSYSLDVEYLFRDGLAQLVERNGVYQLAPSGHVFKHPSGKNSKQFFLASELLRNDIDVYFVAMCVCINAWGVLHRATRIYIDTMGVYPIARAVEELLISAGRDPKLPWEVENFHSHEGFDSFHPILSEGDIALVSASTSGGLATKLHQDKRFRPRSIITLLDVRRAGRVGWVVHANNDFDDVNTEFDRISSDSQETPIELVGEYFAAKGKRPRPMTLSTFHAPTDLKKILDAFHNGQACSLNKNRPGSTAVDIVSFTAKRIVENENLVTWLGDEIKMKTPASVSHIVAADDEESIALAQAAREHLNNLGVEQPRVVKYRELGALKGSNISGVVVCSAIAGNGHALRLLSRDLREICPTASRHFIVGMGVPDTRESWMRLRQFLVQSGNSARPYAFSAWHHIPVGRKHPHDGWSKYSKLMQALEHIVYAPVDHWEEPIAIASLVVAGSLLEEHARGFLPTTAGHGLKLTEGFIYWQPSQTMLQRSDHACLSYLAISSVLQNAREFEDQTKRLRSTLHETVVLDPENFLRFNDGILQAALLRAAYSFELDYSMSVESSQAMREVLEKVFTNHHSKYGEAALEFAAALASGHIRLSKPDGRVLFSKLNDLAKTKGALVGLLYAWWHVYLR